MVTRTAGDRRTQQRAEICIFRRTIARFSGEDLREDLPGDIHGITSVATTGVIGLITKASPSVCLIFSFKFPIRVTFSANAADMRVASNRPRPQGPAHDKEETRTAR
jgi:hypothetical protein